LSNWRRRGLRDRPVKIFKSQRVGFSAGSEERWNLKSAISVAEEDRGVISVLISDGKVQVAVFVEVRHLYSPGRIACGEVHGYLESTVAVAKMDRNVIASTVCNSEVLNAVPVEVCDSYSIRLIAGGEVRGILEGPVPWPSRIETSSLSLFATARS